LWCGVAKFGLCWTNFYDVFPTLSVSPLAKATAASAHLLFACTGFLFATEEKKAEHSCGAWRRHRPANLLAPKAGAE
jgi:hypothetical protein